MASNERFAIQDSTPRSSHSTLNIAGLLVHLYGVSELTPEQAKDATVIFHAHGRTRTYLFAEEVAHELLYRLRQKGHKKGVVFATMDSRNHGIRFIDQKSISTWKGGNVNHAQDMLSMVDGIALDYQTVMDYLESYTDAFLPTQFIMSGISLGGHVAWNLLARDPRIQIAFPIVGCPDMTSLLIDRLGKYGSVDEIPAGTKEWPKAIEKLYLKRDEEITKIAGKKIFLLTGALDTTVPDKFTRPWVEKYGKNNEVKYFCQEDSGHFLSFYMVPMITEWLLPFLD